MKSSTQIFLASLIMVKIILGSIFIYQVELDPLFLERNAMASEEAEKDPEGIAKPARHRSRSGEAGGEDANTDEVQKDPEGMPDEDETIVNEEEIDLNFLLKKKDELKREEEELAKKRAELMAILEEMNNKIAIITQLRNKIRAEMGRKKTIQEKELRHLKKIYSSMKPQKAASLIEKLDMGFAVELLANMKGDAVGSILSFVDIEKAAKITEQLAKRK